MEEIQKTSLYRHVGRYRLTHIKLIGSIIVMLSGFVPFTDNLVSWIYPEFDKMLDARGVLLRSDIWIESLYITIILCSIGRFMKAYHICYFLPIYASLYSLVMYELMRYGFKIDPDWGHRIGFIFMFLPFFYATYRLIEHVKNLKLQDDIQFSTIEKVRKQNNQRAHGAN